MDFDPDHLIKSPFVAGAIGSIVSLRFAPGDTWAARAFNIFCGSMAAGFLAPALSDWWHITEPSFRSGAGFAVGVFSMSVAAAIVQGISDAKLGDIIRSWAERR